MNRVQAKCLAVGDVISLQYNQSILYTVESIKEFNRNCTYVNVVDMRDSARYTVLLFIDEDVLVLQ